jgi:hypothetical protein
MYIKQRYLSTDSVFSPMAIYVTLYFAYKSIVGFGTSDIMPEVPAPQAVLQNPVLQLTRRPVGVIPGRSICPLPASLFKGMGGRGGKRVYIDMLGHKGRQGAYFLHK